MWRFLTLSAVILTACASAPQSPAEAESTAAESAVIVNTPAVKPPSQEQKFTAWKSDFITRAIAKGYDAQLVRDTIEPAQFRESAVKSNNNQAEFTRPIWAYVKTAANASRLNGGRGKLEANTTLFDRIEAKYGVDRHVLTAIWGLESAYGSNVGNYDAVSALASFAYDGRRTAFGEEQLFAVLDLLTRGEVRPEQLKSSWAGAMGMTQFIPATFRDYAVDFDADGNKDLWGNQADALASAANYLSRYKWVPGEPVFAEVTLPDGFDYSQADGSKKFVSVWEQAGVKPIQGGNFAPAADMIEAKLYIPAGAKGPKLLTFKNFDVIKRYNRSNSYAMGITVLSMNLAGKRGISAPWPESDKALSKIQKTQLQTALTAQGFDTGGIDGQIGPNSQKAIRAWQQANNLVADGYVEGELYKRIVRKAGLKP